MDRLLTPLVTRVLQQYVKQSSEGAGSDLKVSFSRGNVLTLHNLELNLAPLLGGAAALAHVRRAFARRLSITIPWTALTSQPIQVRALRVAGCAKISGMVGAWWTARSACWRNAARAVIQQPPCLRLCLWHSPHSPHAFTPMQVVLDTVELVLSAAEPSPAPSPAPSSSTALEAVPSDPSLAGAAAEDEAAPAGGVAGAGWLGSTLQSMALRAGLNVTGAGLLRAAAAACCAWPPVAQLVPAAQRAVLLQSNTGPADPLPCRHCSPCPSCSQADECGAEVGAGRRVCGGRHHAAAAGADERRGLGAGPAQPRGLAQKGVRRPAAEPEPGPARRRRRRRAAAQLRAAAAHCQPAGGRAAAGLCLAGGACRGASPSLQGPHSRTPAAAARKHVKRCRPLQTFLRR